MLNFALLEYGESSREKVIYYGKTAGYIPKPGENWCGVFCGFCAKKSGIDPPETFQVARKWLKFGSEVTKPEMGDIVVFWRGARDSWMGHVGIYIRTAGDRIYVLGGNQSGKVSITSYSAKQLLGFRRPA